MQRLNMLFLEEIVANWEAHPYYDFSQLMSEYDGYSDRLSNNESLLDESFQFRPLAPSEEIADQTEKETPMDGWSEEAHENNLGFGEMEPSASMTGKGPRCDASASTIDESKFIDYVTVGVKKYKLESPVRGP